MNWKALLAALVIGGCLTGAVQQWRLGAQLAESETTLAEAKRQHEAELRAISDAATDAAVAAAAMTAQSASTVAEIEAKYRKENNDAQQTIDSLRADVRDGAVRLRVATARCIAPAGGGDRGDVGTAAGGSDGAGTAELDGATAADLLTITADGDRAIRKLTVLQDYAREAQRVCGWHASE
ncbi:lysis system i-spanin subunit Rz [Paraburkholderia youngii]|uniref:lysis system i-spanin subunit Rz n=1 Tax=Paraburkholderia youngii TaxID=2782701 RepID=UPI003D22414A